MQYYTTKQGDTFDIIAKEYYGSEKYIKNLLEANPDYANTIMFQNGITLSIPELDTEEIEEQDDLIPWR